MIPKFETSFEQEETGQKVEMSVPVLSYPVSLAVLSFFYAALCFIFYLVY